VRVVREEYQVSAPKYPCDVHIMDHREAMYYKRYLFYYAGLRRTRPTPYACGVRRDRARLLREGARHLIDIVREN